MSENIPKTVPVEAIKCLLKINEVDDEVVSATPEKKIPAKIVSLVKVFYTDFRCIVGGTNDTSFLVKSGVRQGCVMSSLLFIVVVDLGNANNPKQLKHWHQMDPLFQLRGLRLC